ncbi:hypothetical protein N7535_006024 [Penicillium sp. DV-2018c]|nr:hypothetical protein N7461_009603 [Penicillium sp. DV-2018c]KAJ5572364.1 hypothetical protein N7535_006024 [Penicillium sp. DV-2018c]
MASPFYNYTVSTFTRGLNTLRAILKKAEEHAAEKNVSLDDFFNARLIDDMMPLSSQVAIATSTVSKALARATFVEPTPQQERDATYQDLYRRVDKALAELAKVDPATFAAKEGQTFKAPIGDNVFDYTMEDYSVRFAIPNFYFHVTTVYNIVRMKGVQIGKMDYLSGFIA